MRRLLGFGGVVLAILLVAAIGASAGSPRVHSPIRFRVVEHENSDKNVDTDGSGGNSDSTGDLLTFHNKIYNASNTHVIGRDLGVCTLIVPGSSYFCSWNTFLPEGQLAVQGLFSFTRATTLAITGGTGTYANARGTMLLHGRSDGAFDFVFTVLP
jgi:Allene oxide cyclase.